MRFGRPSPASPVRRPAPASFFDRCLINAYDAGATTWRDMFLQALPCVEEREDWLRVPASKPEAFIGAAVANLRIPGR